MNLETIKRNIDLRARRYFHQFLCGFRPELTWTYLHLLYIQNALEDALEAAVAGENQRLMIFCPPRHGKSEMCTISFPAYCMHKRPYWKTMIAAYNEEKATDFTRKIRKVCKSAKMNLSEEKSAASEWETLQGGGAISAGVQTGAPGRGANVLIIDDPTRNRGDANSKTISDKVYNEFFDSFLTRLEEPNIVILILTRWSELDLAGRLLAEQRDLWKVIKIPALAEKNDILGRPLDEPLCTELIPLERLMDFKINRPTTFESLYQQNPSIAEGNIIKREWFKYYDTLDEYDRTIFSIDTAFKETEVSDYSVIGVWRETENAGYLEDVVRGKMEFPELRDTVVLVAERYQPDLILVEDKASGISLIQDLQKYTRLPIVAVPVDKSKKSRAHQATGHYESGNIYHRRNAEYLHDYEHELRAFPNGANDDQVDMTTMFINEALQSIPDIIIV